MIQNLSDAKLWNEIKMLVGREKEVTLSVLDHLREVERRMLFATRGYSSLFAYCCQELGYSEDEAQRRISAMRTIRDLPVARASLETGHVSLSTLSEYRSFIHREEKHQGSKMTQIEKEEIFGLIQDKSRRECDQEFVKLRPELGKARESTRALSADLTQVQFVASRELMEKFAELRNLLGNRNIKGHAELLEAVADVALKSLRKKIIPPVKQSRSESLRISTWQSSRTPATPITLSAKVEKNSRYISRVVRAAVWARDRGCCQYEDPVSGRQCLSPHAIQLDHAVPFSSAGESTVENLRLRCRTHNQMHAVEQLTAEHMELFMPSLRG